MQWKLLWYSAPNLNRDLLNDGCMLETHNKVVNVDMKTFVQVAFSQTDTHSPKRIFLAAQHEQVEMEGCDCHAAMAH